MAKKIKGIHNETFQIEQNGKTWLMVENAVIAPTEESNGISLGTTVNNTLKIAGTISAPTGIYGEGANTTIRIESSGRISSSSYGIRIAGANAFVENDGKITATDAGTGVFLAGFNAEIHNSGTIRAVERPGVSLQGDSTVLVNEKGGRIIGDRGVQIFNETGETTKIINHGLIKGGVDCNEGNDTVINTGMIKGYFDLREGNDLVDIRGGKMTGEGDLDLIRAIGGAGNDTFITDNKDYVLFEFPDQGNDTVKSSVSYRLYEGTEVERLQLIGSKNIDGIGTSYDERLVGNSGNNKLSGLAGSDTLDGRDGNDLLKGGGDGGGDLFIFSTGYEKDTIQDFEQGMDQIDLSHWKSIGSFNAVKGHAENHGDDVWISAGKDVLVIADMHKSDLESGDFVF